MEQCARLSIWPISGGMEKQLMLPLSEFKKLLGSAADELSEAQIEQLREEMYRLASVFYDHRRSLRRQKSLHNEGSEGNSLTPPAASLEQNCNHMQRSNLTNQK